MVCHVIIAVLAIDYSVFSSLMIISEVDSH